MVELIDLNPTYVTAIATIVLAFATIYYAYTNYKLWKNTKKQTLRPRKKNEVDSIIIPVINQCISEKKSLQEKVYWWISKQELFLEKFQNDTFKKMIYDDFITGKNKLNLVLKEHDNIICKLTKKYEIFLDMINTDDFQLIVKERLYQFNRSNPTLKFNQEISSLSKQIIMHIIMNTRGNEYTLHGSFKSFWNDNKNYFLKIRLEKKPKKYLEEMDELSNILSEKNDYIIKNLRKILNKYTKEYEISLEDQLKEWVR